MTLQKYFLFGFFIISNFFSNNAIWASKIISSDEAKEKVRASFPDSFRVEYKGVHRIINENSLSEAEIDKKLDEIIAQMKQAGISDEDIQFNIGDFEESIRQSGASKWQEQFVVSWNRIDSQHYWSRVEFPMDQRINGVEWRKGRHSYLIGDFEAPFGPIPSVNIDGPERRSFFPGNLFGTFIPTIGQLSSEYSEITLVELSEGFKFEMSNTSKQSSNKYTVIFIQPEERSFPIWFSTEFSSSTAHSWKASANYEKEEVPSSIIVEVDEGNGKKVNWKFNLTDFSKQISGSELRLAQGCLVVDYRHQKSEFLFQDVKTIPSDKSIMERLSKKNNSHSGVQRILSSWNMKQPTGKKIVSVIIFLALAVLLYRFSRSKSKY